MKARDSLSLGLSHAFRWRRVAAGHHGALKQVNFLVGLVDLGGGDGRVHERYEKCAHGIEMAVGRGLRKQVGTLVRSLYSLRSRDEGLADLGR